MKLFSISSRDKDPTYSGYAQYAALFAMYPFITYFGLFDTTREALKPKIFGSSPSIPGVSSGASSGSDEVFIIGVAFLALGFLPAVVNCLWRRRWGWLFIGLAAVHCQIIDIARLAGILDFGDFDHYGSYLPMIGAKVSFVWIALRGRIFSRSFLVFCVTSAIITSVLAQTTGYEFLDTLRQILPILAFMLAVALFRLVVTAIYQNVYFIRQLGFWRTTKTVFRTVFLWAPILLFAVPYFAGTAALERAIEDAAYESRSMLLYPMDTSATIGCGYLMGHKEYLADLQKNRLEELKAHSMAAGSKRSKAYIANVRGRLAAAVDQSLVVQSGMFAFLWDSYRTQLKDAVLKAFDNRTKNVGLNTLDSALTKLKQDVAIARNYPNFVLAQPVVREKLLGSFDAIDKQLSQEITDADRAKRTVAITSYDEAIAREEGRASGVRRWREIGTDLRENVMYSIYRFHECQVRKWEEATTEFEEQVKGYPYDELSVEFGKKYEKVIEKNIPMEPPNFSGFLSGAKNWSVNEMQDQINTAYAFVRNSAKENLMELIDKEVEPKIKTAGGEVGDGAARLRAYVTPYIWQSSIATQTTVWWIFSYIHAAHMLAHLLFAILCVKSFMYVFGRVAFAKETGVFLTLGDPENPSDMPKGAITTHGQDYALGKEIEGRYFISRRIQPHGMPPRFAIPQPLGAPIARLLHRSMTMNRFDLTAGGESVHFTATGGKTFVEWDLKEGEVVVFDFTDFVGMSDSIKVSTLISTQVTTLLLGKFIFSTATGPGRLILLTEGRPKLGDDPEAASSMPPERLVAWQQNTRFHADSNLGLMDIYFSTAYLKKEGPGQLIMDVDRQKSRGTGLSRFILHFLWPG
ncbi:hypothetical protein [Hwanghaeella sp.]|uniref:hypothetical protein n=1 Tax=Hwanghaeella sp. TaxID=2605943 RepID=UPI003CCC2E13